MNYIGVDFHKQQSSVAVLDEKGNIMDERTLYHNDDEKFKNFFSSFRKGTHVVLEATRNWYWIVDYLQELEFDVKLAHAKKTRIIAEGTIKTDKIDAKVLAHLDRCNFLPTAYIADKEIRSQRELLRYHISLVKMRTSIKNRIHTILDKNNIQHGYSDLFGREGILFLERLELPTIFKFEMKGYLEILEGLNEKIKEIEREIREKCKESRYGRYLITIPGIGYFSGLLLAAEIADINRFKNYKKLCCYAGLACSTHQSANSIHYGHIIKESNKYIRYALIEAVPHAIKRDPNLWKLYHKILRKKGRNKAKIAIARKLLIAIYNMLKRGEGYKVNYTNGRRKNNQVNPTAKLSFKAHCD